MQDPSSPQPTNLVPPEPTPPVPAAPPAASSNSQFYPDPAQGPTAPAGSVGLTAPSANPLIAGDWPGGFQVVKRSIIDFFTNIVPFLVGLLAAVPLIAGIALLAATKASGASANIVAFALIGVGFIALLYVGLCSVTAIPLYGLARADGRKMSTKEFYHLRGKLFWKLLGLEILLIIPVIIGFVLLILPGLIALYFVLPILAIAPYLIVDQNMGVMDSIKRANELTKPHRGKVFGIVGWYILISIVIFLPIAIILALVLVHNAHASSGVSTSNSHSSGSSGGNGGGGGASDPFAAISFAYLYRWLQHQPAAAAVAASAMPTAAPLPPAA